MSLFFKFIKSRFFKNLLDWFVIFGLKHNKVLIAILPLYLLVNFKLSQKPNLINYLELEKFNFIKLVFDTIKIII